MWIILAIEIHIGGARMRTVQMTLDEELVKEVDRVVKRLHSSRSEFTRRALRDALQRYAIEQQERQHRRGYERYPVAAEEFSVWGEEQAWGDES